MKNIMGEKPVKSLIWKIGIPMIFSMILQALYNVVDTAFVINMGEKGTLANQALSYVFPVQILMISIGVGTGIGINTILSRAIGRKDDEEMRKITGNAIFLGIALSLLFVIFGLFFTKAYMSIFTSDQEIVDMGASYLQICTTLSLGCIGFTIYERFLQSNGKTTQSMISQISGALTNIILDYVFIYPLGMGIEGAALATVIGQFVSLIIAMLFHYLGNKEVKNSLKGMKPDGQIIKNIYKIGWSAMLMQALLSINMFIVLAILGTSPESVSFLQGAYGVYYKIYQIPLMACFGLSNALISLVSYNLAIKDEARVKEIRKWGIIDCAIVGLVFTILYQIFDYQISGLFSLAGGTTNEITSLVEKSIRIASIGYLFMGLSIGIQGILQGYRKALSPLAISALRLVIFVIPFAFLFLNIGNPTSNFWWTFPLAELLTSALSFPLYFLVIRRNKTLQTQKI